MRAGNWYCDSKFGIKSGMIWETYVYPRNDQLGFGPARFGVRHPVKFPRPLPGVENSPMFSENRRGTSFPPPWGNPLVVAMPQKTQPMSRGPPERGEQLGEDQHPPKRSKHQVVN